MWLLVLLISLAILLFGLTFYVFVCLDDLQDSMDKPRTVCDEINYLTPLIAGLQWFVTVALLLSGFYYVALFNLPMSVLYLHQYSLRVPEAGHGYHNPIKFFSKRHLYGLTNIYLLKAAFYLLSTAVYGVCLVRYLSA